MQLPDPQSTRVPAPAPYLRIATEEAFAPPEMLDIGVPTHVLWGDSDPALQPALVEGLEPWVPRLTVQHLAGTSHWVVHEQPDAVRQALEQFLSRPVQ